MRDFLAEIYPWLLAFHIIAVMFWMAGMYYLPRLFVYHAEAMEKGEPFAVFEVMEQKLLRLIINPAMLVAWILGLALIWRSGFWSASGDWISVKLALVIVLSGYHGFLARWRKQFLLGKPPHKSRFFRIVNEVPPVLTVFIVILVVVQPF